ncbi:hypothetical protein K456DRAFT_50465 [Colletotrichum gloeosporioides 23]|nr:hypothetical protein K456DRAFT_50465 [Colletotrichum gloeosporioides 23]
MKDSDDRIKDLTRESKLLTQTLTELKSVLVGLEGSSVIKNHAYWDPNASSIRGILEACQNDLDQWEQSYMPKQEGSGAKRMFRLVWNGSLRKARDLQSKFAYHRSQISTSIATINT